VVTEIAIVADDRAIADMGKCPNPCAGAYNRARINKCLWMNFHKKYQKLGNQKVEIAKSKTEMN
jgi:hypothetical protein